MRAPLGTTTTEDGLQFFTDDFGDDLAKSISEV
jgi:hypothetical protein